MLWNVYLSGEIHSDWRNKIIQVVDILKYVAREDWA
jgi:hypothetical protein